MANEAKRLELAEQVVSTVLAELSDRGAIDKACVTWGASVHQEIRRVLAGKVADLLLPTKPEVVDGEVTRAHREAAALTLSTGTYLHEHIARWVAGEDTAPHLYNEMAQALAAAESRGFAAGRASVTAKAEGLLVGLLARIHRDDGQHTQDHGVEQSTADAHVAVATLLSGFEALAGAKAPDRDDARFAKELLLAEASGFDQGRYAAVAEPPHCRACGKELTPECAWVADGCPCNSQRGINHGLVPRRTCTCEACDPEQTGSTRKPPADTEPAKDPR
jgi:hypothetical protein